jgi:hypothetical protein
LSAERYTYRHFINSFGFGAAKVSNFCTIAVSFDARKAHDYRETKHRARALQPFIPMQARQNAQMRRRRTPPPSSRAPVFLLIAFVCTSCTNGGLTTQGTASTTTGTSSANLITSATPLINITSIVRDTLDPNGTIDIIGDNTTAIGTYCVGTGSSGGAANTGPSTCTCDYTFTPVNSSSTETLSVATTYFEGNLLKCPLAAIPVNVASVQVTVTVTTQSNTSAPFIFNLSSNATGLNTSSAASFSEVYRYTCRDIVTIEDLFDTAAGGGSGIYDPLQSEAPTTSYPLDYYATNLGATLNAFAGGAAGVTAPSGWNCPANPITPTSDFHVTIYSESALNGSELISGGFTAGNAQIPMNYDPTNPTETFNARSTFYLANTATGIFNVPLNAYITPTIHSFNLNADGSVAGGVPPIGYGAAPITGSIAGTESCPTNVPIPAGFTWVKVWLFRAGLPTRKFMTSSKFQTVGNISCNPGNFPNYNAATGQSYTAQPYTNLPFNDCYGGTPGTSNSLDTPTTAGGLVSREIEGTLMCVNDVAAGSTSIAAGSAILNAPYNTLNPPPAPGSDVWTDVLGYAPEACGSATVSDPLSVCLAPFHLPIDGAPTPENIDDPANPRFDFLFVVSPPTVMTSDMSNAGGLTYQQYAPYRFRTDSDCAANNPDTAGCNTAGALTMYGIKFYDVGTAGDIPSTGGVGTFPVCALQPAN